MAFAKTLKEHRLNIFCDYCFRNITLQTYFRCEACRFDYCTTCFSLNIQTAVHNKSHNFRIVSNLEAEVDQSGWRIIDELLLLDGMISYGFGNFDDIATILSHKSVEEIKKHFFSLVDIKDNDDGEVKCINVPRSNPNDSFVASFMSKRKEFDSEILNEYENLIDNLQFEEDSSETETELKMHLLSNYKTVLLRRKLWRSFILDRNLVDIEHFKQKEKTDVGENASKYKWLAQFISKHDFNLFIAGLVREKRLKDALTKHSDIYSIQQDKLITNGKWLSEKEHQLCKRLCIEVSSYIKLKRMAIEWYIARLPIKEAFFALFEKEDYPRATILYNWFAHQEIVHET
ncbi:hypothetical protein GINT2_000453 [Glugoides intestinalis]